MKEDIGSILADFGWAKRRKLITHPFFADALDAKLTNTGGRYHSDAVKSQEALSEFSEFRQAFEYVSDYLANLDTATEL